jgi:pantoate--beta-alanine ligase
MKVIKTIDEMKQWSEVRRAENLSIGFVPTMGFLHEGHLNLIRIAREKCDRVVVSIFVNPTQFAPGEDFEKYPRDIERDMDECGKAGVSVVFFPSNEEMYSPAFRTYVITEELSQVLCGHTRPTHFRGVTTVVCKLFNIVKPHIAVFGQKDAQQSIILKRMVEDLNMDIELTVGPIIREPDGLAMSSRNKYLSKKQRKEAVVLYQSLKLAETEFKQDLLKGIKNRNKIKNKMRTMIRENSSGKIDYIEIVDGEFLTEPTEQSKKILVALAVYFSKTRLIDNMLLEA